MKLSWSDIDLSVALIYLTIADAVMGWIWIASQARHRTKEQRTKEKAEQELQNRRRMREAPFFRPSEAVFEQCYYPHPQGSPRTGFVTDKNMLCFMRNEVQLEDGELVVFVVENVGRIPKVVFVKLDDENIQLIGEPDMNGSHGLQYLVYPYQSSKKGT